MGFFDFFSSSNNIKNDSEDILNDNGYNKIYFENESYQIGDKINGKPDGVWQVFSKDGLLIEESNFKDGELHGPGKKFFSDGILEMEYNYKFGKQHGEYRQFHPNGNLAIEANFKNGKEVGNPVIYDNEGNLKQENVKVNINEKELFTTAWTEDELKAIYYALCSIATVDEQDWKFTEKGTEKISGKMWKSKMIGPMINSLPGSNIKEWLAEEGDKGSPWPALKTIGILKKMDLNKRKLTIEMLIKLAKIGGEINEKENMILQGVKKDLAV